MKTFYVDHETWIIEAKDEEEAQRIALARHKAREFPELCNIALCDEDEKPR